MHVCVHVSLLNVYRALFSVYTALLNMYRALLSVYGAFDMFARVCVSLLNVNRALSSVCKKNSSHTGPFCPVRFFRVYYYYTRVHSSVFLHLSLILIWGGYD